MTNLGQSALFLDDLDERGHKVLAAFPAILWVKTAADAISSLKSRQFSTVFLDFDLGGTDKSDDYDDPLSGMEVVRWIKENKPKIEELVITSHNAPAASQMMIELKVAGYDAVYAPFGRTMWWNKVLR